MRINNETKLVSDKDLVNGAGITFERINLIPPSGKMEIEGVEDADLPGEPACVVVKRHDFPPPEPSYSVEVKLPKWGYGVANPNRDDTTYFDPQDVMDVLLAKKYTLRRKRINSAA